DQSIMEVDDEAPFDLVKSLFDREFDLSIQSERILREDYLNEFKEKQSEIERDVNEVKHTISELCQEEEDRRKWRMNTQKTHLMGGLSRRLGRRHSNAFCKFYQILTRFPELIRTKNEGRGDKRDLFRSLHLCEVPGHFLSAIDHFIALFLPNLQWEWNANSLNPHYEYTKASDMFLDDQLIVDYPDRWIFGVDNSGDVRILAESLLQSNVSFDLVTADGSTYSQDDPENQESIVFEILLAEVNCALVSLRNGGSFVMKVYSSFTTRSSRLFALLINLFERVVIYKPPSSKSGNTERYLICLGFDREKSKGIHYEDDLPSLSRDDCEKILGSSRFFTSLQIQSMENNIDLFTSPSLSTEEVNILVDRAIERVMKQCHMHHLNKSDYSSSLFLNRESRPWKELFKDNHVERLKELEDPLRALQLLNDKQVEWVMADDGGMVEDACTEVEWTRDEMELLHKGSPSIISVDAPSHHGPILHSLFIDPELYTSLRSIDNHPTIFDVCSNGDPKPNENDYSELLRDERGFIQTSIDMMTTKRAWIRFLLYLISELESGSSSIKGVTLFSSSHSPSIHLFLSRFSVSLVAMLTILFYRVNIPHPTRRSDVIIEFDLPNYPEDIPQFLKENLVEILTRMASGGVDYLSFVPLGFISELHPLILFYNNEMIKRVICVKLSAL
ncbi:hypothetical protein PENTCL1PPCAC_26547, partial [Pristionchus entomophagus]